MIVAFTGDKIVRGYPASVAVLITAGGVIANLTGATLGFELWFRGRMRFDVTDAWDLANRAPAVADPQPPHGYLRIPGETTALLPRGKVTVCRTIWTDPVGVASAFDTFLPEVT
jgi:hypothetical protein